MCVVNFQLNWDRGPPLESVGCYFTKDEFTTEKFPFIFIIDKINKKKDKGEIFTKTVEMLAESDRDITRCRHGHVPHHVMDTTRVGCQN